MKQVLPDAISKVIGEVGLIHHDTFVNQIYKFAGNSMLLINKLERNHMLLYNVLWKNIKRKSEIIFYFFFYILWFHILFWKPLYRAGKKKKNVDF